MMTERKTKSKTKIIIYLILILLIVVFSVTALITTGITPHPEPVLELNDEMTDSKFYGDISSGANVCFIGDSITNGTSNGGVPWYAPIAGYIPGQVDNISYGGCRTSDIIVFMDTIPAADIYVIAIGTNDCLDPGITTDYYVESLTVVHDYLSTLSPYAHFYFIAPWTYVDADSDAIEHCYSFATALESFCNDTDSGFINSTPYILDKLEPFPYYYMSDNLHPDDYRGVMLYSEAVLMTAQ